MTAEVKNQYPDIGCATDMLQLPRVDSLYLCVRLPRVDLRDADLRGANLRDADLSRVRQYLIDPR